MKVNNRLWDELDGEESEIYRFLPRIKGISGRNKNTLRDDKKKRIKKQEWELLEQMDYLKEYDFTYEASRHESWWLLDSLGPFFDEQWFDDVLRIVKGGKEASVYLCQGNLSSGKSLMAAKVFRPRSLRNLRKDYMYREGRAKLDSDGLEIIDERQLRAMHKRTDYGRNLMHTSWIEHEFRTLKMLHEAGGDVPEPYASDHNAILMDFIGSREIAAPTLNSVRLKESEAKILFDRVVLNMDIMLDQARVHGDLSAYNILYWEGSIYLIDFPQAINPNRNPNAYPIFQRDVERICDYFNSYGIAVDHHVLSQELWAKHGCFEIPNFLEEGGLAEDDDEVYDST
jgi:RIO kinase 1